MTREELIKKHIEEANKQIEVIDKKIMKEAKVLTEGINEKSIEKIVDYNIQREKHKAVIFELYVILGESI